VSKKSNQHGKETDIALHNYNLGLSIVYAHPIFRPFMYPIRTVRNEQHPYPPHGLAQVDADGYIYCHPKRRAEPEQWARALAHCFLHLGMEHFQHQEHPTFWNMACDYVVEKFLTDLKFGMPFTDTYLPGGVQDEEKLYQRLVTGELDPAAYVGLSTAGYATADMMFSVDKRHRDGRGPIDWARIFGEGLADAVRRAVNVASGMQDALTTHHTLGSRTARIKQWFISSYPLLGAIAANFTLVEDYEVCQRMQISVAAISPSLSEIYFNPQARLSDEELKFVMAHEFLHAALRHDARQAWRDAYLWNVACDYVINQWLTEMGVGDRPDGLLYDEQFKGLNAEAIYDRIVNDMRTYRKLATLRGIGLGDILGGDDTDDRLADVDLDAFYRRALAQGLTYHQAQGRGYLPAGLIEEIRALSHPPIPWDAQLARWFDEHFTPLEKVRSYARPSRRQSSTPDIARPSWVVSKLALDGRTFGVILDTSGSMERALLATALGAIASYAAARDVPAARVIFCDAEAYDAGYLAVSDIAGSVKVRGRGGTVLQPAVTLLEQATDFPDDAPILIITDGCIDHLILHGREHAFLIPQGAKLPFVPKGKVFRMR
jgi:predicted metal-dependent peptidase